MFSCRSIIVFYDILQRGRLECIQEYRREPAYSQILCRLFDCLPSY